MHTGFQPFTIRLGGELKQFHRPVAMGVINLSPDSFFEASHPATPLEVQHRIGEMLREGAGLIDLGPATSRPGSRPLTASEEWDRLRTVVPEIAKNFPGLSLSVDTSHSEVVRRVFDAFGPFLVNDITAGAGDEAMIPTIATFGIPYLMMHMKGRPETMQENPIYQDVVRELILFFSEKLHTLNLAGVADVLIDPGFGFGKSLLHNYRLLDTLSEFRILQRPLVVGLSRKSMIFKVLDSNPTQALFGTIAAQTVALLNGAAILRVHDVKAATDAIAVMEALQNFSE